MTIKVSVIGLGYLGATQAIVLAKMGHSVIGIDTDKSKVESLMSGRVPFFEPGLQEMLIEMLGTGRLEFYSEYPEKLKDVVVHFLCVGTPQKVGSNEVDLSAVLGSTRELAKRLGPDSLVVGRSTVPIGTAEKVRQILDEASKMGSVVRVAWNPEFLSEGTAIADSLTPDRIVVGVNDKWSEDRLREIYRPIVSMGIPFLVMDVRTSELVKVAANSFLATKISFINGVASVAEKTGASTSLLAEAIGLDARIGSRFLKNGLGFGGGCLPKDIAGFQFQAKEVGASSFADFLNSVSLINAGRVDELVEMARRLIGGITGKRIAVLGAAFKPNTDDLRSSPSVRLAKRFSAEGAEVLIHDPIVKSLPGSNDLKIVEALNDVFQEVDLVVLATDWQEYKNLSPEYVGEMVARKNFIDGRGLIDKQLWTSSGWSVLTLGEG
jgi:UDPglucose 6-dehydrogenase